MLEFAKAVHEAFRIESTWGFVLLMAGMFALFFGLVGGGLGYLVDRQYQNSIKPIAPTAPPGAQASPSPKVAQRPLPLGAPYIRRSVLELVHELELVSGKEFRAEIGDMLMPGEQVSADKPFQSLFALTPNAGFSIVPSLRQVTTALASVEAFITEPNPPPTGGMRIMRGYEDVYQEYGNLLSAPWVLNVNKYKDGAVVDVNKRFHIILFGLRPVSKEMLNRLIKTVDEAEARLTTMP